MLLLVLLVGAFAACAATTARGSKATASAASKGATSAVPTSMASKGTAPIRAGQTVRGTIEPSDEAFDDETHFDVWHYQGTAGERLSVAMLSEEIDPYLIVAQTTPEGLRVLGENDDSSNDLNARLTVDLPATGEVKIIANTAFDAEYGPYTLRMESQGGGRAVDPSPTGGVHPVATGADTKGRYALLVGINDYPGTEADLDGPVQDATIMRDVLIRKYGFRPENILFLRDAQATRENIIDGFRRHLGQAGPDGVAVFYYSGHGTQLGENRALGADLDPESDQQDEALYVWSRTDAGGIVVDDELGALANGLPAGRILTIIDACYAGTGTRANLPPGVSAKKINLRQAGAPVQLPDELVAGAKAAPSRGGAADVLTEPSRHVLLAASSDQEVSWTARGWPDRGGVASVFTYYLADALDNAGPRTTFEEAMQSVQQRTLNYTQQRYDASQTPQAEGLLKVQSIAEFLQSR